MVDIAEYRYRIGSFRRKSFDIDVTTLNVIGVVGFIGILLFMAGVELNPGPGSIQKQDRYTEMHINNQLMFVCKFCGAHRSSRRRMMNHMTDCHEQSPAKPVYKQYMNNALTPIPRSTAHRRKLTYKSLNTDDFELKMQPPEKKVLEAPEHNDIFENATDENFLEDDGGVTVTQVPMQSSTTVACSGSDQLYTAECSDESYDSDEFSSNYSDTTSDMTKDLESEDESACQSDTVPDSVDDKHCNVFKSHAFLTFAMKHNLAGNAIDDLIDLFNSTCSDSSNTWLPKNYNDLLKTIVQPEIIQHHYCRFCLELYPPDKCNEYRCKTRQCNGLRYVGHVDKQMQASRKADSVFSIADIGAQFQLILSKPGIWESILNTKHRIKTGIDNPNLQDITDGQAYKKIAVVGGFLDPDSPNISLSFNTDGIPLFSSSGVKLWPVFFVINELPPALRFSRENVILAGLWQGKSNVPFYHYLTEIGKQLYKLYTRGIEFNLAKIEIVKPKICVLIGCVDLQTKAYIANMTMHNGEYGCITCMEPGKTVPQGKGTSRCYPYHSPEEMQPYRESEEMKLSAISASRKKRINGICGSSGLQNWPLFDLVLGLVPDYMHGVLLGVTKTLLHKWLSSANSKKRYFVGDKVKEISKRLKSISPPDYIERLPRDLEKHYAHFKANELQAWLLHYSLPCLTGILPDTYLQHFSMLSEGIHILLKNTIDDHDFARSFGWLLQKLFRFV